MTANFSSSLAADLLRASPLVTVPLNLSQSGLGLAVVDEVNGFCTPGFGPLAPRTVDEAIDRMIDATDLLARAIGPKLILRDCHTPGQVERPYPPHCERGSGGEVLVDRLKWLAGDPAAFDLPKDCINGVIGAMAPEGGNAVFDWVRHAGVTTLVVVGICTDICVLTFVTSLLSARTRGFLGPLNDIVVYGPGCATYDLPLELALQLGLPQVAAHPRGLYHVMGLLTMQNQGALIADRIAS